MQKLNLPTYSFRIQKNTLGKEDIFDIVRKQFVALTPEEWVRQHLIHYLHLEKEFPLSLMAIEKGIAVHNKEYRADIVLYNHQAEAVLIVECKAPGIKLTQEVFQQAARYNLHYKANYLFISNGLQHYCAHIDFDQNTTKILNQIPPYKELIG